MVSEAVVGSSTAEQTALFLDVLDRDQFPVETMFWAQRPDSNRWRLIISSPLVRDQGSRAVYDRLASVLRESDVGVDLMTVSVFGPDSGEMSWLLSEVVASGRVAPGDSWLTFGHGAVFRWTADALTAELSPPISKAELTKIWKAERKLTDLPQLLFSVHDSVATMRFHPQHARLLGLVEIKRPFQIAVHRHWKCDIVWR